MPAPDTISRPAPGRLIYLMGASGAGKDSLIDYLSANLPEEKKAGFTIARRYLTRPASGLSPNDLSLSPAEFARRQENGFFAMTWEGYDCRYGISREIDSELERGVNVIINGSRRYHGEARRRYPCLIAVLVQADPGLRRRRLENRNRDRLSELNERLTTEDTLFELPQRQTESFKVITNNGPLATAGEEFLNLLKSFG